METKIQNNIENNINLIEVPGILKRLVRTIAYTFYQPSQIAICNVLLRHIIVDEDSLSLLLKFEKKQLRSMILPLKSDRLIRFKIVKEKIEETGQYLTFTFYYINYQMYLNVIKYKLELLKRKIVHSEDVNRLRPSYTCTNCLKGFTDLDMSRLINMKTGDLTCFMCHQPVKENEESKQQMMNRTLLAKFNQQFNYLYKLVDKCFLVDFDDKLIEPTISKYCIERAMVCRNSNDVDLDLDLFQVNATQSNKTKRMLLYNNYKQQLSINFDDNNDKINNESAQKQTKQLPQWLKHSNLEFNETKSTNQQLFGSNINQTCINTTEENLNQNMKQGQNHDIDIDIDELLKFEKEENIIEKKEQELNLDFDEFETSNLNDINPIQLDDTQFESLKVLETNNSDDVDMYLTIGGKQVHFNDVTPFMEEQMSEEERENYLKILNTLI